MLLNWNERRSSARKSLLRAVKPKVVANQH